MDTAAGLQPALFLEVIEHQACGEEIEHPEIIIAVMPVQLREMFEIHPVNPRDKGQRDKYGGNYGKEFNHLVKPVAGA
jgi:hypothetical protein